jgi:DNA-binding NarL/FixJ family response regulator
VATKERKKEQDGRKQPLRVLVADDSPDSIDQMSSWILERWPDSEIHRAQTPEDAVAKAADKELENIVLDLDFVVPRVSGVEIARRILRSRTGDEELRTRILFRTVHAGDPSYLHQIGNLINDEQNKPSVWGFVDKGAMPKRLVQNAVEQVFIYELSFTDIFSQNLKNSPSKELSDLEFTVLLYICLGVTNDGIAWLVGVSRQSVERVLTGLYQKMKIPTRRDAPQGVTALLESRGRLYYEALTQGFINPHLIREQDAALRERVKKDSPQRGRLYVEKDWLEDAGGGTMRAVGENKSA